MIKQFISDMIHMTEGEKLISYWWLWLIIFLVGLIGLTVFEKQAKGGNRNE